MEVLFIVIVVAALAWMWLAKSKRDRPSRTDSSPAQGLGYQKKKTFLSPAERSFYGVLKLAVGDEYGIRFSHVLHLCRPIGPPMRIYLYAATATLLAACNSIDVAEVDASSYPVTKVCIEENPKVKVADFVSVIEDAFDKRGIETAVYRMAPPTSCEYQLTYTARRSWDFVAYLSYAEIRLTKRGRQVGKVDYDHNNGFSLVKWEGTEAKIGPLLDQMLADFPIGSRRNDNLSPVVIGSQATETVLTTASDETANSSPLSRAEWQKEQLKLLQNSGVSYEEYQRRYREIMAE